MDNLKNLRVAVGVFGTFLMGLIDFIFMLLLVLYKIPLEPSIWYVGYGILLLITSFCLATFVWEFCSEGLHNLDSLSAYLLLECTVLAVAASYFGILCFKSPIPVGVLSQPLLQGLGVVALIIWIMLSDNLDPNTLHTSK